MAELTMRILDLPEVKEALTEASDALERANAQIRALEAERELGHERSAAQCMFIAYDALLGACERFTSSGDLALAATAREAATLVAAADPGRTA